MKGIGYETLKKAIEKGNLSYRRIAVGDRIYLAGFGKNDEVCLYEHRGGKLKKLKFDILKDEEWESFS